jgi:beta-glucosidase
MKKLMLTLLLCCAWFGVQAQATYEYPFRNPNLSAQERIDNLLGLLTPEEKIGMMMNNSRPVARLGIPAYNWWSEALHGVARAGLATVFPQAIGMAATWDVAGHQYVFETISDEARAKYYQAVQRGNRAIYNGLSFWTPNINIFRDPRWGRGQETYGEDPWLTTRLGVAAVKGLQGNDPNFLKTHACAKHFAVHSGPEWNRHSYDAVVSKRDLWETYLPAFKALVQEANVREVMCAYNAFEGQPCCGSNVLLTDILRNQWGYNGMVVSDCGAINDFYNKNAHKTHADAAAASSDAVLHSTDLECGDSYNQLNTALKEGRITVAQLDVSMRRVLQGWIELGMLDAEDRTPWKGMPYSLVDSPEHRAAALVEARKSMTLLKNEYNVLPLSKKIRKIAVIGPNANDSVMQWGNYNGFPSSTVTILAGIRNELPGVEVIYNKGCDLVEPWVRTSLYGNLLSEAKGEKGLLVEFFNNNKLEGTPAARLVNPVAIHYNSSGGTVLAPGVNRTNTSCRVSGILVAPYTGEIELYARASESCKLYFDGAEVRSQTRRGAPMLYTVQVKKGKKYAIRLEQFQTTRNVEIDLAVNKRSEVDFTELVKRIKGVDAVVYAGGLSPQLEGEEMPVNAEGFRGGDKVSIDLPTVQRRMLQALRKTGKPVVFVLCTGSALALEQDEDNYDALLCAWYGGQSGGTAVAQVLFGDYNPAGRLPVTFYKTLDQLDSNLSKNGDPAKQGFENYDMTGRTYRYMKEAPLYPFGHGLSYSTFRYGKPEYSNTVVKASEGFSMVVPVTNMSDRPGEEVVQVYVRRNDDPLAPVKSLRAFSRVPITPHNTAKVTLNLTPESFAFYDEAVGGLAYKPGRYTIFYGGSSADNALTSFELTVEK